MVTQQGKEVGLEARGSALEHLVSPPPRGGVVYKAWGADNGRKELLAVLGLSRSLEWVMA